MIILKSKYQSDFENEYVEKVLLSKIPIKKFYNFGDPNIKDHDLEKENVLILYSNTKKIIEEIENFLSSNLIKYNLLHLSDETLDKEYKFYKEANKVLRGYFHPNVRHQNCYTVPIGFQSGFLNAKTSLEKKYIWSFIGQIYGNRKDIFNLLNDVKPNLLFKTDNFMSDSGMSVNEMTKIYNQTIFSICPFGYINPDSFRVMEILESGCIPIVKKFLNVDYFKYVFGDHPFIVINDWKDAKAKINFYMSDDQLLKTKQKEVTDWYVKYKDDLSKDIENILNDKKNETRSIQFKYQVENNKSLSLRIKYEYWFSYRKKKLVLTLAKSIIKFKKFIKSFVKSLT